MISVTLSEEMWNGILTLLAEHPFKISAPLINAIHENLRKSQQSQQQDINVENIRPGA